MSEMREKAPSDFQKGVAHFIIRAAKQVRQKMHVDIHILRAGAGKSRIEAALAILLSLVVSSDANVYMVYSNDLLLRRD